MSEKNSGNQEERSGRRTTMKGTPRKERLITCKKMLLRKIKEIFKF